MRGKVAKALRKSVYGNRLKRKTKLRERDYRVAKSGMIVDVGARSIYQRAKKRLKALSVLDKIELIRKSIKAQAAQEAQA